MNCLQRPFKIPGKPRRETTEEYVAHTVQFSIELVRSKSTSKRDDSYADHLKLIQLLRKRGYDKYADEIEEMVYLFLVPPVPAKTNQLKFNCALQAHSLMTTFTEQKPTKYKNGKFQEIAALFYSSVAGEETESEEMERACALVIEELKEAERLAAAREAREAQRKLRGPPRPPREGK
jgi:hypothetical protein